MSRNNESKYGEDPEERNRTRVRNSARAKVALGNEDIEGYMRHRDSAGLGKRGIETTNRIGSGAYADRTKRIAEQTRSIADEARIYSDMAIKTAGDLNRSIRKPSKSSNSSKGLDVMKGVRQVRSEKATARANLIDAIIEVKGSGLPDLYTDWSDDDLQQRMDSLSHNFQDNVSYPPVGDEKSKRIVDKLRTVKSEFKDDDMPALEDAEVDLPHIIFDTEGISGNMAFRPVSSNYDSFQKTYNDSLVPESSLQQRAIESEEYKGVDPHNSSVADLKYIDDKRALEYKEDIKKIYDKVEENEILTGGERDSLFSANDLNLDGQGDSLYPDDKYFMSGYQRGQNMNNIKEVDLDGFDFSDFDPPEYDGDDRSSLFGGGDSIMSSINNLTLLNEDEGGSWFSKDESMKDYITPEQRIAGINKARFDNDIRDRIGKYNGRVAGSNNKMLLATGASLGTINEMRRSERAEGKESTYKQPTRKFKGDGVNLVRNSRRKGILLNQQYDP